VKTHGNLGNPTGSRTGVDVEILDRVQDSVDMAATCWSFCDQKNPLTLDEVIFVVVY